ncbi:MAG: hypothetical protein HGGPFJEG_02374 [Ignavibacteria bacterium]|nr:hypothetical protein [Ignavibacteria bacterium]
MNSDINNYLIQILNKYQARDLSIHFFDLTQLETILKEC